AKLETGSWQTLILDRQLPDLDAEELMQITAQLHPEIRVMLVDSAKGGEAEPERGSLSHHVEEAVDSGMRGAPLGARNEQQLPEMIGDDGAMCEVYRMVRLVARRTTTVLNSGPT